MDNILRQDSCQYCRFNMHSYVNNLLHETASMAPEERKQKIYAQIFKPPAPKQPAEMYTNIWEFIKGNKKSNNLFRPGISLFRYWSTYFIMVS